jgi:hypothetical protein
MDCMTSGHLDADGAYRYVTPSSGRVVLLPCHGAELARSLFRFGKAKDGRLATMVDWLLSLENADGSFPCLAKEARPSCLFVTALILRLAEDLRALPDSGALGAGRRRAMEGAAATSATLVLDGGFARAARNKPQGRWFAFGLPLLWDSDVLELLRLVAPFTTANDPRLRPALDLVLSKQAKDGTWPCEKKPKSDTWISTYVELDTPGKASKWVTLAAYRALKAVYEES